MWCTHIFVSLNTKTRFIFVSENFRHSSTMQLMPIAPLHPKFYMTEKRGDGRDMVLTEIAGRQGRRCRAEGRSEQKATTGGAEGGDGWSRGRRRVDQRATVGRAEGGGDQSRGQQWAEQRATVGGAEGSDGRSRRRQHHRRSRGRRRRSIF
jgi:hypothetical protein